MEQIITCINCPMGCRMTVTLSETGDFVSVSGNTCPRGEKYARQECTTPMRVITAVIPISGSTVPLSVKTACPVPKKMIPEIMRELSKASPMLPVQTGDIIIPDILGTGSDIVATRNLP